MTARVGPAADAHTAGMATGNRPGSPALANGDRQRVIDHLVKVNGLPRWRIAAAPTNADAAKMA